MPNRQRLTKSVRFWTQIAPFPPRHDLNENTGATRTTPSTSGYAAASRAPACCSRASTLVSGKRINMKGSSILDNLKLLEDGRPHTTPFSTLLYVHMLYKNIGWCTPILEFVSAVPHCLYEWLATVGVGNMTVPIEFVAGVRSLVFF